MSKVITFSRTYPFYHPRKGEETFFVEKIWKFIYDAYEGSNNPLAGYWENYDYTLGIDYNISHNIHNHYPKSHTIRNGNRWKVGDMFSPRIWSGKPYNSPQIIIGPDIEIKKIWRFDIEPLGGDYLLNGHKLNFDTLKIIAQNDGFTELDDFEPWFNVKRNKGFCGQIICWNDKIEY